MKNHEKRCGQASSGRSTRPRKRSYQTAAAMPGGVAKRGCTRARCSTSGSRDCADSKDDACDARHSARKVQIARCSASTSKNCKYPFSLFVLFRESRELSFAPLQMQKTFFTCFCNFIFNFAEVAVLVAICFYNPLFLSRF